MTSNGNSIQEQQKQLKRERERKKKEKQSLWLFFNRQRSSQQNATTNNITATQNPLRKKIRKICAHYMSGVHHPHLINSIKLAALIESINRLSDPNVLDIKNEKKNFALILIGSRKRQSMVGLCVDLIFIF
ncbi:hypothetical protein BpHYR1_012462 [Brachionus plicatilis]|uniref:Uncharacterized protein n=1 Tax=Brachionus plicatilis TaxID=10195 RepID=A0A3M7PBU1_BRAPC|nr:hypothetical protein BpHYR1_012462 [Brachionus plicatilis]